MVLVNTNPATIMTDPEMADRTYIEPLTPEFVAKIIERERPDACCPRWAARPALNLAVALAEDGTLERYGVELIGAKLPAIKTAEDRELFSGHGAHRPRDAQGLLRARRSDEALAGMRQRRIGYPAHHPPLLHAGRHRRLASPTTRRSSRPRSSGACSRARSSRSWSRSR